MGITTHYTYSVSKMLQARVQIDEAAVTPSPPSWCDSQGQLVFLLCTGSYTLRRIKMTSVATI